LHGSLFDQEQVAVLAQAIVANHSKQETSKVEKFTRLPNSFDVENSAIESLE
jgi:hypothetical protein